MTGSFRSKLSKLRQILHGEIVPRQVEHGVLQSAGMAIRQDEAIAINPRRILAAIVHHLAPQDVRHGSATHGRARMS